MPAQSRNKSITRKQVNQRDQILVEVRHLDKKFGKKFNDLNKKVNGLDKKVNGLDKKVDNYRKENVADRKSFSRILFKNREEQERQYNDLAAMITAFKDQMLTSMDFVRKEYDGSREERVMIGHAQDRQQGEIEALELSDERQNQLLASLDTRVTVIEMNKAA